MRPYTLPFAKLGRHDVAVVGGKNSSLGEMIANLAALGVTVPQALRPRPTPTATFSSTMGSPAGFAPNSPAWTWMMSPGWR